MTPLTHLAGELAMELVAAYGHMDAVPVELKEAVWLLHRRLEDAEADIARIRARLAELRPTSVAGPETGEF